MDPDGQDLESFVKKLSNLYNLRKAARSILAGAVKDGARFLLSEQTIRSLHRTCMIGMLDEAGEYRKSNVSILNSPYVPPNYVEVPAHMVGFVTYVNNEWEGRDLVHLSAFCLWKLNWIHPFRNGNGRISREVAYLVLCAKHGGRLPDKNTVIEQIASSPLVRQQYNLALRAADDTYAATNNLDQALKPVEALIAALLTNQIKAAL